MPDQDHLRFKSVGSTGDSLLSDQLESNLYSWLNQAFLHRGDYVNVRTPASGAYGGDFSRLRCLEDPNYTDGQVWQAARQDWVWETGVLYAGGDLPARVSGVNIGQSFYPVGTTGTYAFHVNYPQGQILFDNAISPTSVVTCEYSFRLYQVKTAECPWWREVQFESYRPDQPQFLQMGSGTWALLGQSRVQLPAVVLEATPNVAREPYEMGNKVAWTTQTVVCHVLAESRYDKKTLSDLLGAQWMKVVKLYDHNALVAANQLPLDEYGDIKASGSCYEHWVSDSGGFYWRDARIKNTRSFDQRQNSPLFYCSVAWDVEVILP